MSKQKTIDRRLILFARLVVVLHRNLEQLGRDSGLTIPQYRFLLMLKRGPRRASDLATLSGIGRPAASALISDLEKKGIIKRSGDPEDRRATVLRLTPAGLTTYAAFERELAEAFEDYCPEGESDLLLDELEKLAHRIDRGG